MNDDVMVAAAKEVSVIIPTMGRPSLRAAIDSVFEQSIGRSLIEVIVVFDTRQKPESMNIEGVDKMLWTGGAKGGGFARQMGVEASTKSWIAFLDDDDRWLPTKLARQLDVASAAPAGPLAVSCRVFEGLNPEEVRRITPAKVISEGVRVSDYLFTRRGPTVRRNTIPTSTLLVNRSTLVEEVRWDGHLKRHQDWDWLIRFDQVRGSKLIQLSDALVEKSLGSPGSVSARPDWRSSIQWYDSRQITWTKRAATDFLAGQALRYALQARSFRGVAACIRRVWDRRGIPSVPSLALGFVGVVPRKLSQSMFSLVAKFGKV